MIKKSIIITILSVFIVSTLFAQSATRNFKGFKGFKNKIEVYTNDGKYIIKAYNNKIIETSFIPEGEIFNAFSYAVVMDAVGTKTQVIDNKQSLQYKTDGISAKIEKSPFKISYFYKDELLIAENKGYIKTDTSEIINFNN